MKVLYHNRCGVSYKVKPDQEDAAKQLIEEIQETLQKSNWF